MWDSYHRDLIFSFSQVLRDQVRSHLRQIDWRRCTLENLSYDAAFKQNIPHIHEKYSIFRQIRALFMCVEGFCYTCSWRICLFIIQTKWTNKRFWSLGMWSVSVVAASFSPCGRFNFILFCSVELFSTLFCCVIFCSVLLYSVDSFVFYSVVYFIEFCLTVLCSVLLYSVLLNSILFYCDLLYFFPLLCSILFYSIFSILHW